MPARAARALRSLARRSPAQQSLHARFHHPPPPPPRPPAAPPARSPVSCLRVPDCLAVARLAADDAVADSLLAFRLLSRVRASAPPTIAALGDAVILVRASVRDAYVARVARTLRRRRGRGTGAAVVARVNGSRALSATAGMGLAAVVAREHRSPGPESLLRLLSSTDGPHRIGVGLLPAPLRALLAALLAWVCVGSAAWLVVWYPHVLPWVLVAAAVSFATRPDIESFFAWTKRCAPLVAKQKTMLLDKLRAQVAPYIMGLRPPVLADYGFFSVVTLMDHADYVYVYAGFMSRWCLLGWYNAADDYNFDKIRTIR